MHAICVRQLIITFSLDKLARAKNTGPSNGVKYSFCSSLLPNIHQKLPRLRVHLLNRQISFKIKIFDILFRITFLIFFFFFSKWLPTCGETEKDRPIETTFQSLSFRLPRSIELSEMSIDRSIPNLIFQMIG